MSRYRGVDLDFGEYNRPLGRVEFDMMSSGPSSGRAVTILGMTFNPAAHIAKGFREQDKKAARKKKKKK